MKIPLCFMALSCVHEWPCFTGLSFCFMAWHMCQMFLTHAGVSDPASYSDDLDKKKGYLCVRVQQTWTAGTKFNTALWIYWWCWDERWEELFARTLLWKRPQGSWRPEWRIKAQVEISGPALGSSNEPQWPWKTRPKWPIKAQVDISGPALGFVEWATMNMGD